MFSLCWSTAFDFFLFGSFSTKIIPNQSYVTSFGENAAPIVITPLPHLASQKKKRKVYKMILSLSCSVTLSYSLSHSFSCAGFYKFVVRDDVISPAGVRNFGTYDDVFEHVHSVTRVRKNWATVVANKSGCANGPEAP